MRAPVLLAGVCAAAVSLAGTALGAAPAYSVGPALAPNQPALVLTQPALEPDKPKKGDDDKPSPRPKPDKPGGNKNDGNKPNGDKKQNDGKKNDEKKKPKPKPDRTPPATPSVGATYAGPGGYVSVSIAAEAGSRVVVSGSGGVVAVGTGTGGYSRLGWTASTGRHTYVVRATDAAGNTSGGRTFSLVADAIPPSLTGVSIKPGNRTDSRSTLKFRTDKGSDYAVSVAGEVVARGTDVKPQVTRRLDLANGRKQVTVEVQDAAGNTRSAERTLKIRIPRLAVDAEKLSDPTERRQVIELTATPNTRVAWLELPDQKTRRFNLDKGPSVLRFPLPDGTYEGGVIKVRDSQGRTGRTAAPDLVVDTTPPELQVASDPEAALEGDLGLTVTTEAGNTITWTLLDGEDVVQTGEVEATGGAQTIVEDVPAGDFDLAVSVTDAYDRTVTDVTTTSIAPDPTPPWVFLVIALGLLAVASTLVSAAIYLVRTPPAWLRRAGTRLAGTRAKVRAAVLIPEQRRPVETVEDAAQRRRSALAALVTLARGTSEPVTGPDPADFPGLHLLPSERMLHSTPARLFLTTAEGSEDLQSAEGDLVVTNERCVFLGEEQHDWWQGLIEELEHDGDDVTMVKRWHHGWAAFEYDDPDLTRLHLDLLMAAPRGESEQVAARAEAMLREEERHSLSLLDRQEGAGV